MTNKLDARSDLFRRARNWCTEEGRMIRKKKTKEKLGIDWRRSTRLKCMLWYCMMKWMIGGNGHTVNPLLRGPEMWP
jgi:hypothetical protein